MTVSEQHFGGCLCGAVRYKVSGALREAIACHCEQCRRTSGYYVVASACLDKDLVIDNDQALTWYQSSTNAKRGFCAQCGSSLFWKNEKRDRTSIMAGSIDMPTGTRLTRHIFVADKADYYTIDDGLPQSQQYHAAVRLESADSIGDQ